MEALAGGVDASDLQQVPSIASTDSYQQPKRYLACLRHRYLNFRVAELESIATMLGCAPGSVNAEPALGGAVTEDAQFAPFWHLTLPNDDVARRLAERCMLVKGIYELWGEGSSMPEMLASIASCPAAVKAPVLHSDSTFRVNVSGFGRKISLQEQNALIEQLHDVDFQGTVRLKYPQHTMQMFVCDPGKLGDTVDESEDGDAQYNLGVPNVPYRVYFGREVGLSDANSRGLLERYSLKKRLYLGPTSMDAEMALVMCNQAQVQKGHFVCDPFAGTGSILVAAAHYGANVFGADIDARVIKLGKEDKRGGAERLTIYTNFQQYNFPPPTALLRMDLHLHPLRPDLEELFHSIVCDPPYGVRAGGRKSRYKDSVILDRATHITSTAPYGLGECLRDLLEFSARLLTVGGRLVYFLPATPETYREEDIPIHPALQLVANSEQRLNYTYSRRLITMQKVMRYDAAAATAYYAANPDPSLPIDHMHAIVHPSGSVAVGLSAAVGARAAANTAADLDARSTAAAAAGDAGAVEASADATGSDAVMASKDVEVSGREVAAPCAKFGTADPSSSSSSSHAGVVERIPDIDLLHKDDGSVHSAGTSVGPSVAGGSISGAKGKAARLARKLGNNFRGKQH